MYIIRTLEVKLITIRKLFNIIGNLNLDRTGHKIYLAEAGETDSPLPNLANSFA